MLINWINLVVLPIATGRIPSASGSSVPACPILWKKNFFFNKIGHAGTLDPLAEGVLPVAIGKTTKLIQFISNQIKEYEFEIKWGEQTSTDDREGAVIDRSFNIPNYKDINIKLKELTGTILQAPPKASAVKIMASERINY